MNNRDKFEHNRALEAKKWLNDPMRAIELELDKQHRANVDRKLGHSPKCSLLKCHSDCSKK